MTYDPGEVNIPFKGKRARSLEAEITRNVAAQRAQQARESRAAKQRRREAREAEKARPKLTRDDVVGARLIRDKWGWHTVIRVNTKSVTTHSPVGELRVPFDQILEVR